MTQPAHPNRRAFLGAALSAAPALSLCGGAARAAEMPTHPLRLVVPYPAGASSDGMSRIVAASMSNSLGQPVVIENKGGANGIVAAEQMSKQPPDGYTFMQVAAGMLTINQSIYKSLP
ncbi:MAG TPA: tripartite tricarboxylate transporter substrate-binding protein, partial [Burkholderiaceae bacterium]